MTPGAHKRHQWNATKRGLDRARYRLERDRHKIAAAKRTMAFWNAGLAAGWRTKWPTVGTALRTECFWLHVVPIVLNEPDGKRELTPWRWGRAVVAVRTDAGGKKARCEVRRAKTRRSTSGG
jgi:hypothetical protein